MLSPPVWFNDRQAAPVLGLLRWFIKQLNQKSATERLRPIARKLNERTMPALFDHNALEEIYFLREAIDELSRDPYNVWVMNHDLVSDGFSMESKTSISLNYSAEPMLRQWLNMPLLDPDDVAWRNVVSASMFAQLPLHLLLEERYPGVYPPEKLLKSFDAVRELLAQREGLSLTWRQLSAACFAGDSKYLGSVPRQQCLLRIFPALITVIKPRGLLFDAHLVEYPQGVLLVENQDTFAWLCTDGHQIPCVRHLHLIYSRGFQGSALRARNENCVKFHFSGEISQADDFFRYWFSQSEADHLPIYFWGDLDFSGMGIIKALRQSFAHLTAWQPGFAPMADAVSAGGGHLPTETGKQSQLNPGATGCSYADTYLLPLIIEKQRFVDQEMIFATHLAAVGQSFMFKQD
jgi:hypothetical protein